MGKFLNFNFENTQGYFSTNELEFAKPYVKIAHELIHNYTGPGNDYLGWVDLPINYDKDEFMEEYIKESCDEVSIVTRELEDARYLWNACQRVSSEELAPEVKKVCERAVSLASKGDPNLLELNIDICQKAVHEKLFTPACN